MIRALGPGGSRAVCGRGTRPEMCGDLAKHIVLSALRQKSQAACLWMLCMGWQRFGTFLGVEKMEAEPALKSICLQTALFWLWRARECISLFYPSRNAGVNYTQGLESKGWEVLWSTVKKGLLYHIAQLMFFYCTRRLKHKLIKHRAGWRYIKTCYEIFSALIKSCICDEAKTIWQSWRELDHPMPSSPLLAKPSSLCI